MLPIIKTCPFIWSDVPVVTIALRTIIWWWQFDTLFLAVDEERTTPMIFMSMHHLFMVSCFLLLLLVFLDQSLRGHRPLWASRTFSFFPLTFSLHIGSKNLWGQQLPYSLLILKSKAWFAKPFPLAGSTKLTGKGCPSIFISFAVSQVFCRL